MPEAAGRVDRNRRIGTRPTADRLRIAAERQFRNVELRTAEGSDKGLLRRQNQAANRAPRDSTIPEELCGSIDTPDVKELVKELLEGGQEAFEFRKQKYGF